MDSRSSSCIIAITDGPELQCGGGEADVGNGDSIVSASFAKNVALRGFLKVDNIDKILTQSSMKGEEKLQRLCFTRI